MSVYLHVSLYRYDDVVTPLSRVSSVSLVGPSSLSKSSKGRLYWDLPGRGTSILRYSKGRGRCYTFMLDRREQLSSFPVESSQRNTEGVPSPLLTKSCKGRVRVYRPVPSLTYPYVIFF